MIQIGLALLLTLLILGASRVLGFWAFLVLLGGILAHFGDHLGTMVGKKRLSLFGFRPKYTAVLVNFTTGAMITMATLLGAVLISAEYREALLGVSAMKLERERISAENQKLASETKELATKLDGAQSRLKELEGELRRADETRQSLAREIEDMTAQKEKAEQLANQLRVTKETGTVAVQKGFMLTRHPLLVPIDAPKAQLKTALLAMLAEIRETVTAAGVDVPPTKPERVDPDLVEPIYAKFQGFKQFYERSVLKEFGGRTPKQIYIRPIARTNLARGETMASANFDVKPNEVKVAKDEEIARTPLDGRLDAQALLQQLINFDKSVQGELRNRGVLAESLDERMDKVSADILMQFIGIIQLVKKEKRWMEVRMIASADIPAYGAVNASYQVMEPTEEPPGASPSPVAAPSPVVSPGP